MSGTDFKAIAQSVTNLAKELLPKVVPGATPVIEAANKVIEFGKVVLPQITGTATEEELQESIDQLEARVFEHADQTVANLRS